MVEILDFTLECIAKGVNLPNRRLTADETTVLAKGGKFAKTPEYCQVSIVDIMSNLKVGTENLTEDQMCNIGNTPTSKHPKHNRLGSETGALKVLRRADDIIIILSADRKVP